MKASLVTVSSQYYTALELASYSEQLLSCSIITRGIVLCTGLHISDETHTANSACIGSFIKPTVSE